jgi:hypothetical protein
VYPWNRKTVPGRTVLRLERAECRVQDTHDDVRRAVGQYHALCVTPLWHVHVLCAAFCSVQAVRLWRGGGLESGSGIHRVAAVTAS